tara:strand:- start:326 stop:637 length:312 start_codon:yes stop_codon:yes gene_type:complete
MEWVDDEMVFDTLDELMANSWGDFKNFMDAMAEHKNEFSIPVQAMLFGGLGQMVVAYNSARTEGNNPRDSLELSMVSVVQNPLFQMLLGMGANITMDKIADGI